MVALYMGCVRDPEICERKKNEKWWNTIRYKDPQLSIFRSVFDGVLKELHSQGISVVKKQAQVITEVLEEWLWAEGFLGDDTPNKLLDTIVYLFGLHFALRSGREHRDLRRSMVQIVESLDSKTYLLIQKLVQKTSLEG